ncbi:prepilin peptidase [Pajaroellobacter abortibovis]|uniref:Prepilin type IV endopeptidase peptidase domain-containing protein n=1 Tax=Pajaroellobacter abortibovis TaxID=1882918 RepID=A0A1L6MYD5_9BACT|nr:A24 family peptidase [Pajaroellobacter abortibovis]APS00522.1 hypothetical protein BCY86_07420 [Pajaroellobacter abortibovis]
MIAGFPYFCASALAVSGVAAVWDLKTGHVPNFLTLSVLAAVPFLHGIASGLQGGIAEGLWSTGYSLEGALLCGLIPFLLYQANAMGGGDVKLLAALGALLRPISGIEAEFYGFVLAAIAIPVRLLWIGNAKQVLSTSFSLAINPFLPADRKKSIDRTTLTWVRFAPFTFGGVVLEILSNLRHFHAE